MIDRKRRRASGNYLSKERERANVKTNCPIPNREMKLMTPYKLTHAHQAFLENSVINVMIIKRTQLIRSRCMVTVVGIDGFLLVTAKLEVGS